MAKSIRSKSKIAARNARRYTPGSDYEVTRAARLKKVAERLAMRVNAPKDSLDEEADGQETDVAMDATPAAAAAASATEAEATMQVDGAETHISTARRSESSRARWRRKKGKKGGSAAKGKKH
ncbi:hypothetical protein MCUN1_003026 [Malassezia cuniculi]|uniref:DUF2423 domain-containing protein n=1 Tax=Malassezia cuniculi TaxID=948313 RepID=A0AAF0J7J1_9BASI|nr:hypothetical protein MCUN1_003026 [Malassezia cuniculi]